MTSPINFFSLGDVAKLSLTRTTKTFFRMSSNRLTSKFLIEFQNELFMHVQPWMCKPQKPHLWDKNVLIGILYFKKYKFKFSIEKTELKGYDDVTFWEKNAILELVSRDFCLDLNSRVRNSKFFSWFKFSS